LINFNKEFGYPRYNIIYFHIDVLKFKYHRYRTSKRITSKCNHDIILWIYPESKIKLSDICKKCLSTFSAEEIEDLKHWLILKKLGVSV